VRFSTAAAQSVTKSFTTGVAGRYSAETVSGWETGSRPRTILAGAGIARERLDAGWVLIEVDG